MTEIPQRIDSELLARYLARECSETEIVTVRRYLMAHADEARLIERYLARLDGVEPESVPPDAAVSWGVVRERLHGVATESIAPATQMKAAPPVARLSARHDVQMGTPRFFAVVRGVMFTATAAAAAYFGMLSRQQPAQPGGAATQHLYATFGGERAELRLADGTKVRLAPASRLRVAPDYGEDRRDVYLDGEAYFDVVHDRARPFTVFAGNASARDIGTAFGVRNYPQDSAVQVVVRSGEVALSGLGRLSAGDLGRLAADGHTSVRHGVDVEKALGWLKGSHSYTDAPLSRVLEDLNRWYNVNVIVGDSTLALLPFTGTIAEASPSAAIELVAATLGLTVHGDGARMVLVAGHRAPRQLSTSP